MTPPDEFDESAVKPVVRRRRRESEQPSQHNHEPQPDSQTEPRVETPDGWESNPESEPPREPRVEPPRQQLEVPQSSRRIAASSGSPDSDPAVDDEYVILPQRISGGRRVLGVAGVALMLLAIAVGFLFVWTSRQVNPGGGPGEVIASVEIPAGSSADSIAAILEDEGVISSARLFRYYVRWQGAGPWKAGEYVEFRKGSSFDEAIEVLDAGPVPPQASVVRVTEGTRLTDALVQISEQMPSLTPEQLKASLDSGEVTSRYKPADVSSWEGLLFPDTYQFEEDATAQQVLQTMASRMEDVLDELGYEKAETLQGRTAYELITIASLIEKEAGAPIEERAMISRVISNRLDRGETLGVDASVLYGLGRSSGELSKTDLKLETPYNTRVVKGLPPTPIALPGRASLSAAIEPADGAWRYYVLVSNNPPTHFFTDDYDEFLEAKADAQANGVF